MKRPTPRPRVSHVNDGTSIPAEELAWPECDGPVARMPKLHVEVEHRSTTTQYGGLILFSDFLRRFKVAGLIDQRVEVLKRYLPYRESDHVLAHAANMFVGGTCIEDMANLQNNEGVRRLFGACRLPDPTTGGDFLRRFDEAANPGSLAALRSVGDGLQQSVWKKLAGRKRKRPWAVIDVDGHQKALYGVQKEGADFSHTGTWSYNALLVSMAGTGECLAVRNRAGNVRSSDGAAEVLGEVLPEVSESFESMLVRADSDFDRRDMREACERHGAYFAFVGRETSNRPDIAEAIDEHEWRQFETRTRRQRAEREAAEGFEARKKKPNLRRRRAVEREYKNMRLVEQWVAETTYEPKGAKKPYRLIIRRQEIEHTEGQLFLFTEYRYRYVITNLPKSSWSAEQVIDATYERCDQERVIAQMGSGLAAWRMPVAEFAGNCAWLEIARLAWNIAKWIAMLVLPAETVRWESKRFRQAYVNVAAQVIKRGRQLWLRISGSHRFTTTLVAAHQRLQV